jgi:pseudouridylate synthase
MHNTKTDGHMEGLCHDHAALPSQPAISYTRVMPVLRSIKGNKRPPVAFESTIYAFGLPYPSNAELCWTLARTVAAAGAESKTVAVIDGELRVGLSDAELDRLARAQQTGGVHKLNASDLGPAMAMRLTGATTVSATMALAAGAGIRVFATGGIGGVHRDVVDSFDESQDLTALARYPVAVVSAGAKAILDLPRTLERLESLGVPVIGYRTRMFPAFYTRDSGLPLVHSVDDVATLARVVRAHWRVNPTMGVLIANPIPEAAQLPRDEVDKAIDVALAAADEAGIRGKAVTPFLLQRLETETGGRSVAANVALAESNAQLAAELAVTLAELDADRGNDIA